MFFGRLSELFTSWRTIIFPSVLVILWRTIIFPSVLVILYYLIRIIYIYITSYFYWGRQKIPSSKPKLIFGNAKKFVTGEENLKFDYDEVYRAFPHDPIVGLFEMGKPFLMIRDPRLFKMLTSAKNFKYMNERYPTKIYSGNFEGHLMNLNGSRWKNDRKAVGNVLSPSKLANFHDKMSVSCDKLCSAIENEDVVDAKLLMDRFIRHFVAVTAYGVDPEDPDFKQMTEEFVDRASEYNYATRWKLLFGERDFLCGILKRFQKSSDDGKMETFFRHLTTSQDPSPGNTVLDLLRNDLQIPLEAVGSTMFMFYAAGFETVASVLVCALFELAKNEDKQKKLRHEIRLWDESIRTMSSLNYLSNVIKETLRMYHPAALPRRIATEDFQIPDSDVVVRKGTIIRCPLHSIYHDPKFFNGPSKFDPERFDRELDLLKMEGAFFPFGEGPRKCIGYNLANLEMKCCLAKLIKKYKFSTDVSEIKFQSRYVLCTPQSGVFLNISKVDD